MHDMPQHTEEEIMRFFRNISFFSEQLSIVYSFGFGSPCSRK